MEPKQQKLSIGYFIVTLNLSYSEFKTLVRKGALFLQVPTRSPRESSERTAQTIDAKIQKLLEAADGRSRETLTAKRETLERVTGKA